MKIFDTSFFSGTFLTGMGLLCLVAGILLLFPPDTTIGGVVLILLGVSLAVYGRKLAKGALPPASKTVVDTLRKAGMLDEKRKK